MSDTTTVGSLSVGDVFIDRDGLDLRVLGVTRRPGSRVATLTVEFVEKGVLVAGPDGPTTVRASVNSMVRVPA